ncbi:MAG: hypothetical protein AAF127_02630 [Pseudomonadota bacterium]
MRIFSSLCLSALALGACAPESGAPEGAGIDCAFSADADWARDCILETAGDGTFAIHHPDDTFRRFGYNAPRLAITPLDGADEVSNIRINMSASKPGLVEFTYRGARYRFDPTGIAPSGDE